MARMKRTPRYAEGTAAALCIVALFLGVAALGGNPGGATPGVPLKVLFQLPSRTTTAFSPTFAAVCETCVAGDHGFCQEFPVRFWHIDDSGESGMGVSVSEAEAKDFGSVHGGQLVVGPPCRCTPCP